MRLKILIIIVLTFGVTLAYASDETWSHAKTTTSHLCGTNLDDKNEYSCGYAHSNGSAAILTKAQAEWWEYGQLATSDVVINKALPEFTTSREFVSYSGYFDLVGIIQEPSGTSVSVTFGVDLYKKVDSYWILVGHCNEMLHDEGNINIINKKVECGASNQENNTYRVVGVVQAKAHSLGGSDTAYADFYTDSNRIVLDRLSVS